MKTRKKILLVDDNENITKVVSYSLRAMGYDTLTQNDSRRALQLVKTYKPDLAILDVDMPLMDGGDVMRQMRSDADICHIPIIFLTGLATDYDMHGRNPNMSETILPKPISIHELAKQIEMMLLKPAI